MSSGQDQLSLLLSFKTSEIYAVKTLDSYAAHQDGLICERTKTGLRASTKRSGSPPYGKMWSKNGDDTELVDSPSEMKIIRTVKRWSKSGSSIAQICRDLDSKGHRPRSGGKWSRSSVISMIEGGWTGSRDQPKVIPIVRTERPTQSDRKGMSAYAIAKAYIDGKNPIKIFQDGCRDWGEPSCWACGYFKNAEYCDVREDEKNHPTKWLQAWDRAARVGSRGQGQGFLEKAHIIPHSLGGSNDPSNFLLLCKKCHKDSPDTISLDMMQHWMDRVEMRSEDGELLESAKDLQRALDLFEVDRDKMESIYKWIEKDGEMIPIGYSKEFEKYLNENIAPSPGNEAGGHNTHAAAMKTYQMEMS